MYIPGSSALVTGGAGGLGLVTAEDLIRRGAAVVIADLASSDGEAKANAIGASFAPVDVLDEESVVAAVDLASASGPLRILVNLCRYRHAGSADG